jgi:hypothetical protein
MTRLEFPTLARAGMSGLDRRFNEESLLTQSELLASLEATGRSCGSLLHNSQACNLSQ